MGLTLQPFWSPGIREPGLEAKGAIIGFGDVHTRAHLYRAILEGLAYGLRQGKERIERRSGTRIERLRVSGGGSQSDAALQLTADIFNLPAERPHLYETSGLGAAIDCAVGLGLHPDFPTAIAAMTRPWPIVHPQPRRGGDLRAPVPRGLPAHVPAAAPAVPQHPRDHRLPAVTAHSANGQVSGTPGSLGPGSGVTARVSSNHSQASNCSPSSAWK